jgi:hypothetical protein
MLIVFSGGCRTKKTDLDGSVAFTDGAGEPFGVHVQMSDTEYELGWLAFSGKVSFRTSSCHHIKQTIHSMEITHFFLACTLSNRSTRNSRIRMSWWV